MAYPYMGTSCQIVALSIFLEMLKVPMKQIFLLHYVKELLKLYYKFFYTFVLHCFVDEICQFECFLLPANYITLCIRSFC